MAKSAPAPRKTPSPVDAHVVRELAEILAETGLTEIEIEKGELRVRVAKEPPAQTILTGAPAGHSPQPAAIPAPDYAASAPPETPAPNSAADVSAHPGAVSSPMVGTAYLAPEPGAPAFIQQGQAVKEGDTLLLIEAMKTFNPIPAPRSGKVLEIFVDDGQPVEFGEALVIIG
jgi:acetyl-CoA carboxylase biotin carboxyl carrier protein